MLKFLISFFIAFFASSALAQVATSYFYDTAPVENPAALLPTPKGTRVVARSSSGKGEYNANEFLQEETKTSSTEAILTHAEKDYSLQFAYIPTTLIKTTEYAEYNPLNYNRTLSHLILNGSYNLERLSFGGGYELATNKVSGNNQSQQQIRSGASYSLPHDFLIGAYAHYVTDKGQYKETRSWIESGFGLGWVKSVSEFSVRLEGSFSRAPEIYQETSSNNDPNYRRMWQQTRYGGDLIYSFANFSLSAGAESQSKVYEALKSGETEKESETKLRLGGHFLNRLLSIFIGQTTQKNSLGKHNWENTSHDVLIALSFGAISDTKVE